MTDTAKIAIRASTQDHLDIEDIKDNVVILKDGSSCLILSVTAINFGLLSEREQDATIYAYAALLNSLAYPIQIVIRSARKDISGYLKLLEEAERKETKDLIKNQIHQYRQFVNETVQKNNVLDKKFYLSIPMSALEIGVSQTLTNTLTIKAKRSLPFDKNYILERAKINLFPKRDHLLRQLSRIGLKGRQLITQELIRLFFDIYNPESGSAQMAEAEQYETPMVSANMPPAPLGKEVQQTVPIPVTPVPQPVNNNPVEFKNETVQDQINNLVNKSIPQKLNNNP